MRKRKYKLAGIAVIFLALDFLYHSILLLFVEPGMGFNKMADYLDPNLLVLGLSSIQ